MVEPVLAMLPLASRVTEESGAGFSGRAVTLTVGASGSGMLADAPPSGPPVPASAVPAPGVPASGVPASIEPASGEPASGEPASGTPASGAGGVATWTPLEFAMVEIPTVLVARTVA